MTRTYIQVAAAAVALALGAIGTASAAGGLVGATLDPDAAMNATAARSS